MAFVFVKLSEGGVASLSVNLRKRKVWSLCLTGSVKVWPMFPSRPMKLAWILFAKPSEGGVAYVSVQPSTVQELWPMFLYSPVSCWLKNDQEC